MIEVQSALFLFSFFPYWTETRSGKLLAAGRYAIRERSDGYTCVSRLVSFLPLEARRFLSCSRELSTKGHMNALRIAEMSLLQHLYLALRSRQAERYVFVRVVRVYMYVSPRERLEPSRDRHNVQPINSITVNGASSHHYVYSEDKNFRWRSSENPREPYWKRNACCKYVNLDASWWKKISR